MGMFTKSLVFLAGLIVATFAHAQDSDTFASEYVKRVEATKKFAPLGNDLFGDEINGYSGLVQFSVTDVSLPGNNALPVSIKRRYSFDTWAEANTEKGGIRGSRMKGLFGDWQLDLPHMHGHFPLVSVSPIHGWQTGTPGVRCSQLSKDLAPPAVNAGIEPDEYWHGNQLYVPGEGDNEILYVDDTITSKPQNGLVYRWATKNRWFFSCLPTTANGVEGEAFLAIAPDGTKYWFDQFLGDTGGQSAAFLDGFPIGEVEIFPTRVEDRFGNSVVYQYDKDPAYDSRLLSISASDGRRLSMTYTGYHVKTVSDGTRTWTYNYENIGTQVDAGLLRSVVLPDGSAWTYGQVFNAPGGALELDSNACGSGPGWLNATDMYLYITHPSGAMGTFKFNVRAHGRTFVPKACKIYSDLRAKDLIPLSYSSVSLTKKEITGPGIPTETWSWVYPRVVGQYDTDCLTGGCPTTKVNSVTQPDGSIVRQTYGIKYGFNDGMLLQTERLASDGVTVLSSDSTTYQIDPSGQGYPAQVGIPFRKYADPQVGTPTPVKSHVVTQQGVTFTRTNNTFDAYARPTSVLAGSSGNAGGDSSRTESTTYLNDTTKWVLSLPKVVSVDGTVVSQIDYDANDLPWKVYSFGVLKNTLTYNADSTLATVADGAGNITTLSNWYRGIPQTVHYPATPEATAGASDTAVVNNSGLVTSTTDEMGYTTNYAYDPMGRMAQVTYPTGDNVAWGATVYGYSQINSTEFGIPAGHWRSTVQTGYGLTTTYYDAHWRPLLVQTEDTGNIATRHFVVERYDAMGRQAFSGYPVPTLASINDALKGVTTTYDALGRATQVNQDSEFTDAGGHALPLISTTQYLTGFKTKTTNPRLFSTTTSYQVFDTPSTDAPVSVVQDIKLSPLDQVTTSIPRDVFGNPTSITRRGTYNSIAVSSTRNYVYDANHRLCKTITPEAYATLVDYDGAGNIAWSVDGSLLTSLACDRTSVLATDKTMHSYDARNRQLSIVYPGTTGSINTTYFPDGVVNTLTSGPTVWSYTYNKRRMPLTETLTLGTRVKTISHTYDWEGFESLLNYPDGLLVPYTPNGLGQATQASGYVTGVTYYPNGGMSGFKYGNGIVHTMWQNDRQLPDRSLDKDPLRSSVLDDGYDYDYNGNVAAITDGVVGGGGNRTMAYDGLDRLISTSAPNLAWKNATTSYDPLDNIRTNTVGARTWNYTYNTINRLTQLATPDGTVVRTLAYDGRGNIGTNGADSYVFTKANRLASVTGKESYIYDGYGRRVQITRLSDGKVSYPVYSLSGQLIMEEDQRSNKTTDYISLNGSLVAKRSAPIGTSTWTTLYEHTDALHSPVAETDANGNVFRIERYTPYGEPTDSGYDQGPGFTGHVTDAATGLSYMQQRYYDPTIGRFLSVDPETTKNNTGANFNRYWYANDNPYKYADPDGRRCRWAPFDWSTVFGEGDAIRRRDDAWTQVSVDGASGGNGRERIKSDTSVSGVLGKVWASTTTAVGIAFGTTAVTAGLFSGTNPSINFNNGAIQFKNVPGWIMPSAMTIGNTITYGVKYPPSRLMPVSGMPLGFEESQHVRQAEMLGPMYLPAHFLFGSAALMHDGDWHGPSNLLEIGPHSSDPQPW